MNSFIRNKQDGKCEIRSMCCLKTSVVYQGERDDHTDIRHNGCGEEVRACKVKVAVVSSELPIHCPCPLYYSAISDCLKLSV